MKTLNKRIILASKSPRRSRLLREAGFDFVIRTKEVEETYPEDMPVDRVAAFLAEKKAVEALEFLQEDPVNLRP